MIQRGASASFDCGAWLKEIAAKTGGRGGGRSGRSGDGGRGDWCIGCHGHRLRRGDVMGDALAGDLDLEITLFDFDLSQIGSVEDIGQLAHQARVDRPVLAGIAV